MEPTFATAADPGQRDWGYAGLLLFTGVLLLRPQEQIPSLAPLHVAEICALLGIAPMLLHRFARRLPVFRLTPEAVGLALFGAAMLVTVPFSIWPGGALSVFTDAYLKILIVFVLMMNTLTSPRRLEQITWLILLCCGYIAARAVIDYARGANLVEGGRVAGAVGGIFGNPNDLALNMVTFLPAAALVALGRRHTAVRRLTAALIVVLMLATIVFSKSRGGVIGFAVMLISLILLARRVRPGLGPAALAVILVGAPLMPSSFWGRMSSIVNEQEDTTGSREARRIVMEEGIRAFLDHPLTGVGAGQFQNYNPPDRIERWRETHAVLIQVAAEIGAFGLAAFVFLIVRGFMAAYWTRRTLAWPESRARPDPLKLVIDDTNRRSLYEHSIAMSAGLIGWFTCAMFASVAYNWTFYYVLALIVAARELTRDRLLALHARERSLQHTPSVLRHFPGSRGKSGAA